MKKYLAAGVSMLMLAGCPQKQEVPPPPAERQFSNGYEEDWVKLSDGRVLLCLRRKSSSTFDCNWDPINSGIQPT